MSGAQGAHDGRSPTPRRRLVVAVVAMLVGLGALAAVGWSSRGRLREAWLLRELESVEPAGRGVAARALLEIGSLEGARRVGQRLLAEAEALPEHADWYREPEVEPLRDAVLHFLAGSGLGESWVTDVGLVGVAKESAAALELAATLAGSSRLELEGIAEVVVTTSTADSTGIVDRAVESLRRHRGGEREFLAAVRLCGWATRTRRPEIQLALVDACRRGHEDEEAALAAHSALVERLNALTRQPLGFFLPDWESVDVSRIDEALAGVPSPLAESRRAELRDSFAPCFSDLIEVAPEVAREVHVALGGGLLQELERALDSEDLETRRAALACLCDLGPRLAPALPRVARLVGHADPVTAARAVAALALCGVAAREYAPALLRAVPDTGADWTWAEPALQNLGAACRRVLGDDDVHVRFLLRAAAARPALRPWVDPQLVDTAGALRTLSVVVTEASPTARREAARAIGVVAELRLVGGQLVDLGEHGATEVSARAVGALLPLLEDEDTDTRVEALRALARIAPREEAARRLRDGGALSELARAAARGPEAAVAAGLEALIAARAGRELVAPLAALARSSGDDRLRALAERALEASGGAREQSP